MSTSEADRTNPPVAPHRGGLILVMGVLSFTVCGAFGIVAWIMGNNDLAEMRAGRMDRSGEGLTQIGKIIGMIVVILNILVIVAMVLVLVLGGGMFFMSNSKPMNEGAPVRIERNAPAEVRQIDGQLQMPKAKQGQK